jgi:hypothetical protein
MGCDIESRKSSTLTSRKNTTLYDPAHHENLYKEKESRLCSLGVFKKFHQRGTYGRLLRPATHLS